MKYLSIYFFLIVAFFGVSFEVHASTILSTVKIDDSTSNGPALADSDLFGSSVASLGDLNSDGVTDIVVGAASDDAGGLDRGSVHIIFLNADGTPSSTVKIDDSTLNGPALADSDLFGSSVASLGDLNSDGVTDIVVGAHLDETGGSNRGAVHIIFLNADGTPSSTVKIDDSTLNGPVLANSDQFGYSVASLGDLNSDGVTDIAVGAFGDDTNGSARGSVHIIFLNADGTPSSTVKIDDSTLNGPVLANSDQFGYSVASLGDLNSDGVTDLVVGAVGDSTGGSSRGAAHILFLNTDGSIDTTVKIDDSTSNGPALADSDLFGSSVASLGDHNSDGVTDIVVGATGDDTGGSGRGAAYVLFLNTDGSVDTTVKIDDSTLNGPVLANSDQFGVSLTSISDLNSDGVTDLVVGAHRDNTQGADRGAVYVFFLPSSFITPTLVSLSPLDDATGVDPATNLTLTFSDGVSTSTGSVIIYRTSDNALIETIDIAGLQVTQSASNTLVVNPSTDLERNVEYYINIASTTIVTGLEYYAGITDTTTWSFTTEALPQIVSSSGGGGGGGGGGSRSLDGFSCHDPKALNYNTEKNHRRATCIYDARKLPSSTPQVTPSTASALAKIREIVRANKALILEAQKMGIVIPSALLALLTDTSDTSTFAPVVSKVVPQRDLRIGFDHPDVLLLQKFLNTHGFVIAQSGVGSPGNETTYFGNRTQDALRAYQVRYGITPAIGTFGPKTRAHMLSL